MWFEYFDNARTSFALGHWNHNVAVGLPIAVYGASD